jgi:hypothetical protein
MFHNRVQPHHNPHPLKTLLGVIGIIFGIVFLLQAYNTISFSFDMTNPVYLKIFAVYAIMSGILLAMNIQRHGMIRY